ncbi:MAG: head decoration protein [Vulcanimicrobiaceae bacterium]
MTGYQKYGYPANAGQVDSFTPGPDLQLPGSRPRFQNFTILGGLTLLKGSVLGVITATGKLTLSASAAGDGSQNPVAVLDRDLATFDINGTTPLDTTFDVIVGGAVLNPAALVLGTGMTAAAVETALLARGFSFRNTGFSG